MPEHEPPPDQIVWPITYRPPQGHHGHWAIVDTTGTELACPHTPPVPGLIAALETLNTNHQPTPAQPTGQPGTPQTAGETGTPTPATIKDHICGPENKRRVLPTPTFKTREWMDRNHVNMSLVRRIITTPDDITEDPGKPAKITYYGHGYEVAVATDINRVVGIFPILRFGSAEDTRTAPSKTDTRPGLPQHVKSMRHRLADHGFTVVFRPGAGHYNVTHPEAPGKQMVLPATPSDHRWARNFITQIRRVFGIDLGAPRNARQPPDRDNESPDQGKETVLDVLTAWGMDDATPDETALVTARDYCEGLIDLDQLNTIMNTLTQDHPEPPETSGHQG